MNATLATLICAVVILGLFYWNRDKSVRTSSALWIAVVWFWIIGSRPVTAWFGGSSGPVTVAQLDDGSPTDAAVLLAFIIAGLIVVTKRGSKSLSLLKANRAIILYFAYGLVSTLWADVPGIGMKRWVKATGDIIMALVVVTDVQPLAALRRLFSRVGFVLLPISELLIRYYPNLGRGFDIWGGPSNVGVTQNKNLLGPVVFILTLGAAWQILRLWKHPTLRNRFRQLAAQGALLGIGIWLLHDAHSATSGTCFTISAGLLVLTNLRSIRGRPRAVQKLVVAVAVIGLFLKVSGLNDAVVEAIGRNPDLTGRASELWPVLITMSPNVVVGAGFESFWTGDRMAALWERFKPQPVNEAHNGYIEVYLNLGLIGLALMVGVFIHGYRRSLEAVRSDPESGGLILAYLVAAALYSYTEAGFRMLFYPWSFLLLMIFMASAIAATARQKAPPSRGLSGAARPFTSSARATSGLVIR